jgi:hypothetical protein
MRNRTGVVIPVYLPAEIVASRGVELLRETVASYLTVVAHPAQICLAVDGADHGAKVAHRIAAETGVTVEVAPENRGKLQGARIGARRLLERMSPAYVAVVDQDGDHFANELLNFVRMADHVARQTGDARVMVLGRRASLHHPMGLLRGELEPLANRMLLNALRYHAAVTGVPLRLEYATSLEHAALVAPVPDFHSGYKLFDRATVAEVFLRSDPVGGECAYRHAVEAVMTVEALLSGARLAVVNRSTFNAQPVSTFGLFDRVQLTADMIIWPCRRLDVPLSFVRQWLREIAPSLLLTTLVPEGRDEVAEVCRRVVLAYGDDVASDDAASEDAASDDLLARQPLFL